MVIHKAIGCKSKICPDRGRHHPDGYTPTAKVILPVEALMVAIASASPLKTEACPEIVGGRKVCSKRKGADPRITATRGGC